MPQLEAKEWNDAAAKLTEMQKLLSDETEPVWSTR